MQVVNGYTEIEDFATVTSLFLMNCANRTVYMCVYHTNRTMLNSFMQWFEIIKKRGNLDIYRSFQQSKHGTLV